MSKKTDYRIVFVTGSFPPDVCGVGDYTSELSKACKAIGCNIDIYFRHSWSFLHLLSHFFRLRNTAEVIHIQHPTAGFQHRIAPYFLFALPLGGKKVVTLHEYTRKGRLGKLLARIFFYFADHIIFTSVTEQAAAIKVHASLTNKSSVIPIGSNIPLLGAVAAEHDVGYFGLIRPGKGIEEFISILEAFPSPIDFKIVLIGQVVSGFEQYAEDVAARVKSLGGSVMYNLPAQQVAETLAKLRVALLPFPDGISRRRGSALAAMGNGALVLSLNSTSAEECDFFKNISICHSSLDELRTALCEVLHNYNDYSSLNKNALDFVSSMDWSSIAVEHKNIYEAICIK